MNINEYQNVSLHILEYHWTSIIIHEYVWISENINEYEWISCNINQYQWTCEFMKNGSAWGHGCSSWGLCKYWYVCVTVGTLRGNCRKRILETMSRNPWISMNINEYQWMSWNIIKHQGVSMHVNEYQWANIFEC